MLRLLLALAVLTPSAAAQASYRVTLPTGGLDGDALAHFERGVELLHSFEYDDARDAFRDARRAAPTPWMAAWGEAMTHNHPVWQRQDRDAGLAALGATGEDPGLCGSSGRPARYGKWEGYVDAVCVLFGAPGTATADMSKEDRDDAYLASMAALAGSDASDRDARAFHALALLGSAHEGRDYAVYERAARVAQSVLDEDPQHPGALHYLIHAYDDPDHAELALPAARAYSQIASAASHALHMPTHIYFALGLWEEASALNTRAYRAAADASARRGETLNNHGWHALYWLNYSELQLGRDDAALALLDTALVRYGADPSPLALAHLVRMRAQTAVTVSLTRTGDLDAASPLGRALALVLPLDSASASTRAADLALGVVTTGPDGDAELMRRAQGVLDDPDAGELARASATMSGGLEFGSDDETVRRALVGAAEAIEATPVTFGPPMPALFPHEMLVLAGLTHGDAARCVLDAVEARAPARRIAAFLRDGLDEDPAPSEPAPPLRPSFCD